MRSASTTCMNSLDEGTNLIVFSVSIFFAWVTLIRGWVRGVLELQALEGITCDIFIFMRSASTTRMNSLDNGTYLILSFVLIISVLKIMLRILNCACELMCLYYWGPFVLGVLSVPGYGLRGTA